MITDEQRYICNRQKELYEYAQENYADVRKFSYQFMNSYFCNASLDKPYSVDQFADVVNWVEFLQKEFPIERDLFQKNRVSFNAAGWVGFTYRYLHFVTGLQSRDIAKLVPVDRLVISYPGLHTVDEDMAAEIIIHDFNISCAVENSHG